MIYDLDLLQIASDVWGLPNGRQVQLYMKKYPVNVQRIINGTLFLPDSSKITERVYCIINNIYTRCSCKMCDNLVSWNGSSYHTYCSRSCKGIDPDIKSKVKATNLIKLGVDNPSKSELVKSKKVQTCLKNHGTEYPQQNTTIFQQSCNTNLSKFGTLRPSQNIDIKNKTQQTNIERYGHSNIAHGSNTEKVRQTMLIRYERNHHTQQHLSLDTLDKLQNKDWLYEQHYVQRRSLLDISTELGMTHMSTTSKYLKSHGLETQFFFSSTAEREVAQFLSNYVEIETNVRDIIGPFELDIYIESKHIAIEYCGLYWHSTYHQHKNNNYHKQKLDACQKLGIRLITIFEDEWIHKSDLVKQKLLNALGMSLQQKIFARKCIITHVKTSKKLEFFDTYHIQGNGPSSIDIGLEYNKKLVACMSFIKQKGGMFILNRYATSNQVVGGFSKLLSYFKKNYEWRQIISFADLRWSQGDVYEKHGFILDKILPPDYEYV